MKTTILAAILMAISLGAPSFGAACTDEQIAHGCSNEWFDTNQGGMIVLCYFHTAPHEGYECPYNFPEQEVTRDNSQAAYSNREYGESRGQ